MPNLSHAFSLNNKFSKYLLTKYDKKTNVEIIIEDLFAFGSVCSSALISLNKMFSLKKLLPGFLLY